MSEREDLTFASGADTCAAWLYRPEGVAGPAPCVVMAHGFSGTREDTLPAYAERFAAAGMAVLLFDYRHFGDSSGEPRQLLDIGRQQADYRAAVAFARTLGGIDARRIALFGTSFSGGHVVAVAAQDPSIAAVVSQCPFADGLAALRNVPPRTALRSTVLGLADQAAALAGRAPRLMPAVGPPGSFAVMTKPDAGPGFEAIVPAGSRWRNEVAARVMLRVGTYRPVRSAPSVACPLLVCVCEHDSTTPPSAAIKMGERAPRGEVIRYPIGHFDIYVGEHFERAVADQTAFLQRHLARVTPAATVG
jgi:pimeloyl-ACP methyl ester carboxylesterase